MSAAAVLLLRLVPAASLLLTPAVSYRAPSVHSISSQLHGPASGRPPVARSATRRAAAAMQAEDPFNSAEFETVAVTLKKPLGVMLVEVDEGTVIVNNLLEEGSAKGTLQAGDVIRSVMGQSVASTGFDDVMGALSAAPEEVELSVSRIRPDNSPSKAARVEDPSKVRKAFDKNFGSVEATTKLTTKMAKITTNKATWKNPIYYLSALSVFVPLIMIASYSPGK